jgi:hypothetical protein
MTGFDINRLIDEHKRKNKKRLEQTGAAQRLLWAMNRVLGLNARVATARKESNEAAAKLESVMVELEEGEAALRCCREQLFTASLAWHEEELCRKLEAPPPLPPPPEG